VAEGGIIEGAIGGGEAEANDVGATVLNPIAAAVAATGLETGRPLDPRLASYLAKQEELVETQLGDLREQRGLQVAHLRVRLWKDRLGLMLQGFGVAAALIVLIVLGALAWQAHRDHGLVIEAFTAPPGFAARGIGGEAVAGDVLGKLSSMVSYVRERSFSSTGGVTTDTTSDVKIEIPQTGVSLSEAWRVLREWLGSARKVSGSLRDEGDGRVTLTARLDGGETFTATGAASDLGTLEQNIAEQVYGATDPNNLYVYLIVQGRKDDALAAARRYATEALSREDRANAITLMGDLSDDPAREAAFGRMALRSDPGLLAGHYNIAHADLALEHPEEALSEARRMLTVKSADQPRQHQGAGAAQMLGFARSTIDELTGNLQGATAHRADYHPNAPARSELLLENAVDLALRHDPATSLNLIAEANVYGVPGPGLERIVRYYADAASDDWKGALAEAEALIELEQTALSSSKDPDAAAGLRTGIERRDRPMLAIAQAHTGNAAASGASIAFTPLDCYSCLRARGIAASLAGDHPRAERWFADAIRLGPDLPWAYVERGRARLDAGDTGGALSDAETAARLGPHFADALKLSGDTRARQGRWSEAIASYDSALAEAPAWAGLKHARAAALARVH
jgi:tetratricopeptide (TPR) repeat protein